MAVALKGFWPPPLDWQPGRSRGRRGMGTQHPAPAYPGFRPGLLISHPGLTKNRVELVPWSTAPTNGPKTAFFAAAMKAASGRRAIAAGVPGDSGGQGRRRQWVRRASRRAAAELWDRASGGPFTREEPSHPAPPTRPRPPLRSLGLRGRGGGLFVGPAN